MDTTTVEPHEMIGHAAQVMTWANQVGRRLVFVYLSCGPGHETKWFAGAFSKYMLPFRNGTSIKTFFRDSRRCTTLPSLFRVWN